MSTPGAWPSPMDYTTAVQNPQNCFEDPDLRTATLKTSRNGMPALASGNFAVVYQLQSGTRAYAVRCFIRPVTDQQQRYEALSQHLSGFSTPALVDFSFLQRGIRVRGQWYPVVRMEWVAGQQLHRYIDDHQAQPPTLTKLAAQWRGVVAGLRGAHTAHGDLQHGNILVDAQGQIKLVDYDGWYIPTLHGQPPGEVGHPNFQHPDRLRNGYYEANADAFSSLVIYLALIALRADPSLWSFHNGENLIFLADDFQHPGQTKLWSQMKASPDPEVQRLALVLGRLCQTAVATLPDLETVLQRLATVARPQSITPVQPPPPPPQSPPPLVPQPPPPPLVVRQPLPPPPTDVICPQCRQANRPSEIYCQHCTTQLVGNQRCGHCGRASPANARFCTSCGRGI